MDEVKKSYNKVSKEIKESPRKCDICGSVETMKNLMLKYDNGKIMCDDCAFKSYERGDLFNE